MFTKSDLKNGDVIVRRNGDVEIAIVDRGVLVSKTGWNRLRDVREDLTDDDDFDNEWDIMKVYRPDRDYQCQFYCEDRGNPIYDRERDTKKLYNGKVVCIDLNGCNEGCYTVGKIYEFKDGRMTSDDGYTFGDPEDGEKFYTFEDWANFTSSKFIEVVE